VSRLRIRRTAPLIPLLAFMAWPGTTLLYFYSTLLRYLIFFEDFSRAENGGVKNVSLKMDTVRYENLTLCVSKAY